MREARLAAVVAAALTVVVAAASAQAAPSKGLSATFTILFPKGHPASNAPCDPDTFCGVGTVAGYGAATITILDDTFDEVSGSPCLATTRVEQVDLLDGGGSLVLASDGSFCRPGGSGDSRASESSYGFPGRFDLRFDVVGSASTGVFANASGGGSEVMDVDGGSGVWHLDGVLAP